MKISRYSFIGFVIISNIDPETQTAMIFKIVLVGDIKVGKTSIRLRYLGEGFRSQYISTIGSDFAIKIVDNYQLQIWDLAGQSSFRPLIKNYYTGAHGLVLVFDLTREDTIQSIPRWIDEFKSAGNEVVPSIIIGNKLDLRSPINPGVDLETGKQFAIELSKKYHQPISYVETSALTGENIDVAFQELVKNIKDFIKNIEEQE